MVSMKFFALVLVAISAVCARPFDVHDKDDGSLVGTLHDKLHAHLHDLSGAITHGGSIAKSKATAGSIAGGYDKGSLSASAAHASSISLVKKGDYHDHGDHLASAKGDAKSEAGHYDKEHDHHYPSKTASLAKSTAAAESSAANYHKPGVQASLAKSDAEAVSATLKQKENYHPEPHYFDDKPHGEYPHAASVAKSTAEAASYGKKGASIAVAESDSKAVSYGGKGKSESIAAAESSAAAYNKEHYFNDQPQGDAPYAIASANSKAAAESYGKKGSSIAVAESDSKAVSYGGKGKSVAKSSFTAEAVSKGHKESDTHQYFSDQPYDAFNLATSKSAADAFSSGKKGASLASADSESLAVNSKYYKGKSMSASSSKAESFYGHGISGSAAASKAISASA